VPHVHHVFMTFCALHAVFMLITRCVYYLLYSFPYATLIIVQVEGSRAMRSSVYRHPVSFWRLGVVNAKRQRGVSELRSARRQVLCSARVPKPQSLPGHATCDGHGARPLKGAAPGTLCGLFLSPWLGPKVAVPLWGVGVPWHVLGVRKELSRRVKCLAGLCPLLIAC